MPDDRIDGLHLALMQDVLPVGCAMFERIRQGGPSKVVEIFAASDDGLPSIFLLIDQSKILPY